MHLRVAGAVILRETVNWGRVTPNAGPAGMRALGAGWGSCAFQANAALRAVSVAGLRPPGEAVGAGGLPLVAGQRLAVEPASFARRFKAAVV